MKRQAAWGALARVFFLLLVSALLSRVSRVAPRAPRSLRPHIAQRKLSTVNRRHGRSAHADGSRSARHIMHTSRSPTAHAAEAAAAHFLERRGVGQRLGRSVDEIGARRRA